MSIYVSGHEYHDDINDLDDLANQLKRKVLYPAFEKLSPEQQKDVQTGGSGQHQMLTPDGSYYSTREEVLNLYTAGWGKMIPNLVKGIKYFMDELGVKYGEFKVEKSGMFGSEVIRIPILQWAKSKNTPPLLNMANANAHLIFGELLGFPGEEGGYSDISPADLYRKIEELEKHQLDIHARDAYTAQHKSGPTMFHGGLSSEDISSRLEQIKKIAKWALDNHYDQLYVA
jgi:hypothetical protein